MNNVISNKVEFGDFDKDLILGTRFHCLYKFTTQLDYLEFRTE